MSLANIAEAAAGRLLGVLVRYLVFVLLAGVFALVALYHLTIAGIFALELQVGVLYARLIIAGILETKKGHFKPDKFEDRYETALTEMIKAKQAGKKPPTLAEPSKGNVINLMDALRRSAKAERSASDRSAPAPKRKAAASRKRPAPRRKVRKAG